jgi:uncharacterized membrane protein HdeD (DUF308 family)
VETIMSITQQELRKHWGWFLALGIFLIFVGVFALGNNVTATFATVLALGVTLFIGGIVEAAIAFSSMNWRGFGMHLAMGLFMAFVGFVLIAHPDLGSAALTMMLAVLLLVSGTGRVAFAIVDRYPGWGWGVVSGIASVLLGGMVFSQWPSSALWVLGTIVGCEFLFRGINWIALAIATRRASKRLGELTQPT